MPIPKDDVCWKGRPYGFCKCDNGHEQAGTCCGPCWNRGFRSVPLPGIPSVPVRRFLVYLESMGPTDQDHSFICDTYEKAVERAFENYVWDGFRKQFDEVRNNAATLDLRCWRNPGDDDTVGQGDVNIVEMYFQGDS